MGGTERQVVELAVELRARGLEVEVLSRWPLHAGNQYVANLRAAGVRVRASGWHGRRGGRLHRLGYMRAQVESRLRPGAGTTEGLLWRWQARRVRALQGPGFVLHEIPYFGVISAEGRAVLKALEVPLVLTAFGRMRDVVVNTEIPSVVVTADGQPDFEPPRTDVEWIPSMGSRETARISPDLDREASGLIAYGGRLVAQKGVDVLIRALAASTRPCSLAVAGYGPEREALEHLAASLGVDARFVGPLPAGEFFALLRQADLAVVPSRDGEGIPSVIAEALASGTPVVASAVGGMPRVLEAPYGAVVQPDDPAALAAAIAGMSEGLGPELRRAAREAFETVFAPATVVPRYLACYEEALRRAAAML